MNNFQTTGSCERRSEGEHRDLGRTVDYTVERLEESVGSFLLREFGLLTGLLNKCEVLKAFL